MVKQLKRKLRERVDQLAHSSSVPVRASLHLWEISRLCARQLVRDRALQVAAALSYQTIFSLIPIAVMSLLLFRAFIDLDRAQDLLQNQVYAFFNLDVLVLPDADPRLDEQPTAPPPEATLDTAGQPPAETEEDQQLRTRIDQTLNDLIERAYAMNFASVGVVGILVLVWAALALIITMEDSFNHVFDCPSGRPWSRKIFIYWTSLTLGPMLLFISLSMGSAVVQWAGDVMAVEWLGRLLSRIAAVAAAWLMLVLLYVLMPNTRVSVKAAALGALIAAILWEIIKWGFGLYVTRALPYSALYGSLGLIPLFLFWIFITWLIVLFGLEMTYTLQAMEAGRELEPEKSRPEQRAVYDPDWLLPLLVEVGRCFDEGKSLDRTVLAQRLQVPARAIDELSGVLEEANLVHHVASATGQEPTDLALARSPGDIKLQRVMDLGRQLALPQREAWDRRLTQLLEKLDKAQDRVLEEMTLADLVATLQDDRSCQSSHDEAG